MDAIERLRETVPPCDSAQSNDESDSEWIAFSHADRAPGFGAARAHEFGAAGWSHGRIGYLLACSNATEAFGSIKCKRPSSDVVAPFLINSITCAGVRDGSSANSFAARLATLGEAMEVPDSL